MRHNYLLGHADKPHSYDHGANEQAVIDLAKDSVEYPTSKVDRAFATALLNDMMSTERSPISIDNDRKCKKYSHKIFTLCVT